MAEPSADLALFEAQVALVHKRAISPLEKLGTSYLIGQTPLINIAFLGFFLSLTIPGVQAGTHPPHLTTLKLTGKSRFHLIILQAPTERHLLPEPGNRPDNGARRGTGDVDCV